MKALFTSRNLIGDGLYVGPALAQWHKEHPDNSVEMFTLADHVACIYSRMGVPIDKFWFTDFGQELYKYDFKHTFNVNKAFQLCDEKKIHIAEAYAELLGVKLEEQPENKHLKPIFIPTAEELNEDEKGLILVSMFSASCASREGKPPNKMLPWRVWEIILRYLRSLDIPIRFIGGPKDRTEHLTVSEEEYLLGVPLNRTALMMKEARLVVSVDNGMSHLAASQETPTFLFYPQCLGMHYILPKGNPNLGFMHMNPTVVQASAIVAVMRQIVPQLLERSGGKRD